MKSLLVFVAAAVVLCSAEEAFVVRAFVPDAPPQPKTKAARLDIAIDEIVAIGKLLWPIIEAGKPVVNYQTDYAGAVPKGADWLDLAGFEDHSWGPFGWDASIGGAKAVTFAWDFIYSCKGTYDGHGAFLDNVGAQIKKINVYWGFTCDVNVTISSPNNHGSRTDPIAALQVEVTMAVTTLQVVKTTVYRCRVSIEGNCSTKILSCA